MTRHTSVDHTSSDLIRITIKNVDADSRVIHSLRYSSSKLMRHSKLLRSHIMDHGRVTFELADLRDHKYPLHDPEAFAQVIHWLAENCRLDKLSWATKRLQWDEDQQVLVWRGWKNADGVGSPGFERIVPWAPLECRLEIGTQHAVSFDKAMWVYYYMLQLKLDETLLPIMLELQAGLFDWLEQNTPTVSQIEALWTMFGDERKDRALGKAGLHRLFAAMRRRELHGEQTDEAMRFIQVLRSESRMQG
ncbi:hypothetical protein EJ08DRAFT_645460 [Tothia fuscella]|uniref:Uncharacterized protein n=1 Tax=Tothia fuscella TaxID=1048955 RepID=A0A9P4U471_9PEZI|nr:hypothetical protein EJ08DRAFT_645460 [Tothia fuscella]